MILGLTPYDTSDISSYSSFDAGCHFVDDLGNVTYYTGYGNPTYCSVLADCISWDLSPGIWEPADTFSKVFVYSSTTADLENGDGQNILNNPIILKNYTCGLSNMSTVVQTA